MLLVTFRLAITPQSNLADVMHFHKTRKRAVKKRNNKNKNKYNYIIISNFAVFFILFRPSNIFNIIKLGHSWQSRKEKKEQ